jgi:hypothetical protein
MEAYEQVRDDVTSVYADAVEQQQRDSMQEGLTGAGVLPSVSVSGSKPAWLGERARKVLAGAAGIGSAVGLALMATLADESGGAASTAGGFAIVSMLVAYLTVAGFGTVAFSIGSGGSGDDQGQQTENETTESRTTPGRDIQTPRRV